MNLEGGEREEGRGKKERKFTCRRELMGPTGVREEGTLRVDKEARGVEGSEDEGVEAGVDGEDEETQMRGGDKGVEGLLVVARMTRSVATMGVGFAEVRMLGMAGSVILVGSTGSESSEGSEHSVGSAMFWSLFCFLRLSKYPQRMLLPGSTLVRGDCGLVFSFSACRSFSFNLSCSFCLSFSNLSISFSFSFCTRSCSRCFASAANLSSSSFIVSCLLRSTS